MNTPSAMMTTTCSGTPSCCRATSSPTIVPTSLPGPIVISSESRLVRLRSSGTSGETSGGGAAAASRPLRRSISVSASWYLIRSSSFGGDGASVDGCSTGDSGSGAGWTNTDTGGGGDSSDGGSSWCSSSRAALKTLGGVGERSSDVDGLNSGMGAG